MLAKKRLELFLLGIVAGIGCSRTQGKLPKPPDVDANVTPMKQGPIRPLRGDVAWNNDESVWVAPGREEDSLDIAEVADFELDESETMPSFYVLEPEVVCDAGGYLPNRGTVSILISGELTAEVVACAGKLGATHLSLVQLGDEDLTLSKEQVDSLHSPGLVALSLEYFKVADAHAFDKFDKLAQFRLVGAGSPAVYESLSRLPLWMLHVEDQNLSDEDVRRLTESKRLLDLSITDGELSARSLDYIARLTELRILDASGMEIPDTHAHKLKSLTKLLIFDALGGQMEGSAAVVLAEMPQLVELNLYGNPVADETARVIGKLRHLRKLDVSKTRISDQGFQHLAGNASLVSLSFGSPTLTSKAGRFLRQLKKLEQLEIAHVDNLGDGLRHLPADGALAELIVSRTKNAHALLQSLAHVANLRRIRLYECQVQDAGLVGLRSLVQLKKFEMSSMRVSDAALEHVAAMPAIEVVSLYRVPVTNQGIKHLAKAPRLQMIFGIETETTPAVKNWFKNNHPKIRVFVSPMKKRK